MWGPDVELWLCPDPRLVWGKGLVVSGLGPSVLPVPGTAAPCLALSAGLAWGMRGALFSSKAAWRSWGGEPTAQQVSFSVQSCFTISPSMSSAGGGGWWLTWEGLLFLPGCAGFPTACFMDCGLPPSWFSESAPLVPRVSSPTAQLLCYRLGQPPDGWKGLGGVGDLPAAGPKTPLG